MKAYGLADRCAAYALIGASAGWAVGIGLMYYYDPSGEHGLADMATMTLLALTGAAGGAGVASIYVAGKKAHAFYRKIFPINKQNNLEMRVK